MRCPDCSYPLDETMAEGRDEAYDTKMVQCHACSDRARTVKRERTKGDIPPGAKFITVERD